MAWEQIFEDWFLYGLDKEMIYLKNKHSTERYSFKLFNLSIINPFNDVYDNTTQTLIANNINEYTLTVEPGHEILVGHFSDEPTSCGVVGGSRPPRRKISHRRLGGHLPGLLSGLQPVSGTGRKGNGYGHCR